MQNAQPIHSNSTFRDFYTFWLFRIMKEEVSENTWNGYWLIARVHLLPYFADDFQRRYRNVLQHEAGKRSEQKHSAPPSCQSYQSVFLGIGKKADYSKSRL